MDRKRIAFQDRRRRNAFIVTDIIFRDHGFLRAVFQKFRILCNAAGYTICSGLSLRSRGRLCIFLSACLGSRLRRGTTPFLCGVSQLLVIEQPRLLFFRCRCGILSDQYLFIGVDHLFRRPLAQLRSLVEQHDSVTVFADAAQIMADKDNGLAHLLKFLELMIAFRLEKDVSHRQSLIHDQNLRIDIDRHRKSKAHEHTTRICLHRLIDVLSDIRKFQNRVQLLIDLLLCKADHSAVQIDILNSVIFIIKTGTKLQQSRNPAIHGHTPSAGVQDTCDDLQDRRLPGTVRADDTHTLPLPDSQVYPLQGMMLCVMLSTSDPQRLFQPVRRLVIQFINFLETRYLYRNIIHNLSYLSRADCRVICLAVTHITPMSCYSTSAKCTRIFRKISVPIQNKLIVKIQK